MNHSPKSKAVSGSALMGRGLEFLAADQFYKSIAPPAPVAVPDTSKMFAKPDLGHEQTSVLAADATNIQQLLSHVDLLVGAAQAALGKAITKPAEHNLTDFCNGLIDLRAELQDTYTSFDLELERR